MKKLSENRRLSDGLFIGCLLCVTAFVFWGTFEHGMQFDEVYRVCNLFSMFFKDAEPFNQAIYSIRVFGRDIPIMYKDYISSFCITPMFPILFFENVLVALRSMYIFYFLLALILFYYAFGFYTGDRTLAMLTTLFIAVNPVLHPQLQVHFATIRDLIPISVLLILMKRGKLNWKSIFIGVFVLCLSANIAFYSVWHIAAFFIVSVVFYPKFWPAVIKSWKNILAVILGGCIGLFHFVLYNVMNGFPTVKTLVNSIFFVEKYNESAIDYKTSSGVLGELPGKLEKLKEYLGGSASFFLVVLLAATFLIIFEVWYIKRHKRSELAGIGKIVLVSLVCFYLTFVFILVSPNAKASHHFCYLVGFYSAAAVGAIWLMGKLMPGAKMLMTACALVMIGVSAFQTGADVLKELKSGGTGNFSPAIFDLHDYLEENEIDDEDMMFIDWGFHAQLYFLNRGDFKIQEVVFQLMNSDETRVFENLMHFFDRVDKEELFFVAYDSDMETLLKEGDVSSLGDPSRRFAEFVDQCGGEITEVQQFYERDGEDVFALYRLSGIPEIRMNSHTVYLSEMAQPLERVSIENIISQTGDVGDSIIGLHAAEGSGTVWTSGDVGVKLMANGGEFSCSGYIPDYPDPKIEELTICVFVNDKLAKTVTEKEQTVFSVSLSSDEITSLAGSDAGNFVITVRPSYSFVPAEYDGDDVRTLSYILTELSWNG
ncbi:MAG: hypothetical protein ACI3VZ_07450 [Faecousia sp.]